MINSKKNNNLYKISNMNIFSVCSFFSKICFKKNIKIQNATWEFRAFNNFHFFLPFILFIHMITISTNNILILQHFVKFKAHVINFEWLFKVQHNFSHVLLKFSSHFNWLSFFIVDFAKMNYKYENNWVLGLET